MALNGLQKLRQILINDKHFNPARFNNVIACDVFKSLQNYMDISKEDLMSRVDIDADGNIVFKLKVKCKRIKLIGILNN